jgi:hypothetical protein
MPLNFEACLAITEAQYNGPIVSACYNDSALTTSADRLDAISALQDVEMFHDIIKFEVEARTIAQRMRGGKLKDPLEDRDKVASVVGTVYAASSCDSRYLPRCFQHSQCVHACIGLEDRQGHASRAGSGPRQQVRS